MDAVEERNIRAAEFEIVSSSDENYEWILLGVSLVVVATILSSCGYFMFRYLL